MNRRPLLLTPRAVVLALVIAGCADAPTVPAPGPTRASASGNGATTVTTRVTRLIPFVIDGAKCGLATTVRGTAEVDFVFHVTQTPNGRVNGFRNSFSHGTAVGDDGTRYVFNYVNNARFLDATAVLPPGGPLRPAFPFIRDGIDGFHLVGAGGAPQIHVFQRFRIQINADGSATMLDFEVRGDPACDPI
jgi:hypothetical protein